MCNCEGNICSCDIDTSIVPSFVGPTGDIGLTGATGLPGNQGLGEEVVVKKLYFKHTYPTDGASATITLSDFQNALLAYYAYDKVDGALEHNVFTNDSMAISSLSIYALANQGNYAGGYYNLTNMFSFPNDKVKYSTSNITIDFAEASDLMGIAGTDGNPVAPVMGINPIDFYIVIFA